MSSPTSVPSKPPSRKPISFFVTKPKEADHAGGTKEDKDHVLRLKALMDNIFEPRSSNSNPLGIPEPTTEDAVFQSVKYKESIRKTKPKITDYSKDLSDHESESGKSD
jgi:hypothetical protein